MAIIRHFRRRVNLIAVLLLATMSWIFYLIVSAPAASDRRFQNSLFPNEDSSVMRESVTRMVMAAQEMASPKMAPPKMAPPAVQNPPGREMIGPAPEQNNFSNKIPRPPPENMGADTEKEGKNHDPDKLVDNQNKPVNTNEGAGEKGKDNDSEKKVEADKDKEVEVGKEDKDKVKDEKKEGNEKDIIKEIQDNIKDIKENIKNIKEGKIGEDVVKLNNVTKVINATVEQAVFEKVENKVKAIGESVKNKTLEKLANLGVYKKKEYEKLVYQHINWNLSLSFEDIGNIMKDTEYLQKKQNLTEMAYQPLYQPGSNATLNISSSKYGLGYCECRDLSCLCCVRVFNKRMRLNSTSCAAIAYSSKSQELQYEFSVDKKTYFTRTIAAEFPPKICLEAAGKVAGICTLFSNVTAKVNVANEDHKIHLSGCMEFDLTLYNRTLSGFPIGCFQIPGERTIKEEENKAQNMINFVP
ncbi:uncharacterized protein LOC128239807 isoform X2 [Mya arenaria]|uniref:uncharacterized protein LOC128239807 isoform X2 n=1 Tax=Mya arenaria TaxID=6604 RepID=UPI0022DEA8B9|nr:uncharacterized protein LOC128239807 isoform X2 [Mya arenaria]